MSVPSAMFTTTGPAWVCHGNRAPGWTVNLTTAVREASLLDTTVIPPWSFLTLNLSSTWSGNTAREPSGSLVMGATCAADGSVVAPNAAVAAHAAARAAVRFLVILLDRPFS